MKNFKFLVATAILIQASLSFIRTEPQSDRFEAALNKLAQDSIQSHSEAVLRASGIKDLNKKYFGICINGRSIKDFKDNYSLYLEEFRKGPCSPIMFIPGIAGSKLVAQIDCYALKGGAPDVFEAFGWKTCVGDQYRPKSEYVAWIPVLGPNSFLISGTNERKCFEGLLKVTTYKENGVLKFKNASPGVVISPYGATPGTRGTSKCAFDGISNLLGIDLTINLIVTKVTVDPQGYFDNLREVFQHAGYVSGLSMQALPYDFRMGYQIHNLGNEKKQFEYTINSLYTLTGKKVLIAAHSMGNLQVHHNLWNMKQADKDNMVAMYIALGAPVIGAPETTMNPLGMMDFLRIFHSDFLTAGMTGQTYQNVIAKLPASFQLMWKRFYKVHAKKPWMKQML